MKPDRRFWGFGVAALPLTMVLFVHGSAAAAPAGSPVVISLGDYAKGDGSDETEAIQKVFDALVAPRADWKPHLHGYPHRAKRGVLRIPAPPKFYGISHTIKVLLSRKEYSSR